MKSRDLSLYGTSPSSISKGIPTSSRDAVPRPISLIRVTFFFCAHIRATRLVTLNHGEHALDALSRLYFAVDDNAEKFASSMFARTEGGGETVKRER